MAVSLAARKRLECLGVGKAMARNNVARFGSTYQAASVRAILSAPRSVAPPGSERVDQGIDELATPRSTVSR